MAAIAQCCREFSSSTRPQRPAEHGSDGCAVSRLPARCNCAPLTHSSTAGTGRVPRSRRHGEPAISSGVNGVSKQGASQTPARALLDWRQEDLSKASGVGTATIQRIEKNDRPITGYVSTLVRIQAAFEDAGVLFIDDDEMAGIGLRLASKKLTCSRCRHSRATS